MHQPWLDDGGSAPPRSALCPLAAIVAMPAGAGGNTHVRLRLELKVQVGASALLAPVSGLGSLSTPLLEGLHDLMQVVSLPLVASPPLVLPFGPWSLDSSTCRGCSDPMQIVGGAYTHSLP